MSFGLKNDGATYMRAMTTMYHDIIYKEIEVYVDDVIIKSRESADHLINLKKFFNRLRKYNLKLNPTKCEFLEYQSLLKKDILTKWTEECQTAFDAMKSYFSNPSVLVPLREGDSLLLYLSVSDNAFGYVQGQHDETGKKKRSIYYLSKKFTPYKMNPLKYIFQKVMPTGKLAQWKMLLSEFDIVYVTQKAIKAQALANHLEENPVDEAYELLKTYFFDEEVSFVGEDISEAYPGWRVFFDGAVNHEGNGIGAVLISESGQHYPMAAKLQFHCTNNMAEYEACIMGLRIAIDKEIQELLVIRDSDLLIHQNEFADAFATIFLMIKHPDTSYIDPVEIYLKEQPAHYLYVKEEPDKRPWYFDIKNYLKIKTYLDNAIFNQKKAIRRMANNFFLSGETLYRRTPNMGLHRCVDAVEAMKLLEQIHVGVCGSHMNGLTLAKKILRSDYFWMTMEYDCCKYVQKYHQCQVHSDFIRVPPHELNAMSSRWPFVA
ncbi:uncharacterized protein LOC129894655 [Solanum dulcamara]|uniref:uncharacterized protein LOC129894655 n=1 Tax=Solanum dulcamara TaxID=45834 RepID=UPI00248699AE|nr:uncharacterized protein LOC129894655 [Solanum dulcamara]